MEKIKRTKQKSNIKSTSGITLLSLVVIIIIMIILAFITINLTIGEEGIFKYGRQAKVDYKIAKYVEDVEVTRGDVAVDNLGIVTLDNLIERIEEKNIFAGGKITKINEEKAEAITKEGYVIIITAKETKYDRTEKVEEIPELKEGNIVISFEPQDWTKENVTVNMQNNVEGSFTIKYSFDKENWSTYTNPIEIKKNVNVFACLENIVGQRSNYTNMEITIIDKLEPENFEPSITTGSKSITINANNAKDAEATKEYGQSGIEEIWYSKDNGNTWQTNEDKTATSYTYDNLEQNTTHLVQVKVIDKAKNETITQAQEVTTGTVTIAEGNLNISGPSWNASTHKASVTISKGSGISSSLEVQYQVVTSLSNVTESGWTAGTSVGSINHNDYVCARLWDGKNGGSYTSQQIQDSQPPEVIVSITGKSSNSITASVSAQDNQYGMAESPTYTFYIKKTEEADTAYEQKQSGTGTTCTITGLEQTTSYTVKVTTSDIAGNQGAGTSSDTTTKQLVTGISLNETSITMEPGATETLTATITPDDAYEQSVTWNSSDTSVATVTNGTITAKAAGTTTITATAQDGSEKSASCTIIVENPSIELSPVAKPGDYVQYTPTAQHFYASPEQTGQDNYQHYNTADYKGLWQVLYNDETNGLQIISADSVGDLILGHADSDGSVTTRTPEDEQKVIRAYNNSINTLNSFCRNYVNTAYATSGRSVGSDPINPDDTITTTETLQFKPKGWINGDVGAYKTNDKSNIDFDAMKKATNQIESGIYNIEKKYWLASRYLYSGSNRASLNVFLIHETGLGNAWSLWSVYDGGRSLPLALSHGVRPVITLKSGIKTSGGNGSSSSPYVLVPQ